MLTEPDLEDYIFHHVPALPLLQGMDDTFYPTYAAYAARKFFFVLDSRRTRKVPIKELILSEVMAEFLELYAEPPGPAKLAANWFSVPAATRVYGMYVALDVTQQGLLSKDEFALFKGAWWCA